MIKKKKVVSRQNLWLLGIAVLLLLLLSSSLFLITRDAGGKSSTPNIATKTPNMSNLTPTASIEPTPQLLFAEDFSSHGKGWYLNDRSGYTRTMANNELILQDTNQKTLIESLPNSRPYDNFTINATFTLHTGDENDSVGLYLRGDSNLDHDYRLDIFGDKTYGLSKESLGAGNLPENIPLMEPAPTPALKDLGQENTISVTMQDSTISLTINDQPMTTLSDNDYKKGQIALFVNNGATSGGVTASFSHLEIYGLPPTSTNQK